MSSGVTWTDVKRDFSTPAQATFWAGQLSVRSCPVHWRTLSSTPGLYSIDACSTLSHVWTKKAAEVVKCQPPTGTLNSQGPTRNPGSYLQSSREPQSRWKKWRRKKEMARGELGQERTALKYFLSLQELGQESRPTVFYLVFLGLF